MRFYTDAQLNALHDNLERYDAARRVRDALIRSADTWAGRSDEFLRTFVPPAQVPRAFYVNFSGCPVHGRPGRALTSHPWRYDPFEDPWRLTCTIGGESYPSNDFAAFVRSGLTDRSLLTGAFTDDGYGWQKEGEEFKYWFVGYCCFLLWGQIFSAADLLSRAYVLTGDSSYAHKTGVLLRRIAEIYPEADYAVQSLYSEEASPGYTGRIDYQIGETMRVCGLCEAYDGVRDALDEPTRAFIEHNLIREFLGAVYDGQVRGNYGDHQRALLTSAIVLGDEEELQRAVDWVMFNTGEATALKEMRTHTVDFIFRDKAGHAEGIDFALDNLLFREGVGWESSPSYCSGWLREFAELAELLERFGVDLYARKKFRRMFRWPSEMACPGGFVPAIGDAGSVTGGNLELPSGIQRMLFERYDDPEAARALLDRGYFGESAFSAYEDLLRTPLTKDELEAVAPPSDTEPLRTGTLGGYGLAILRSGDAAASVYYGRAATEHAHFDRLTLEVFAHGRKLVPDPGSPEVKMEAKKPAAWSKNTASHNTVVVDEKRQDTMDGGEVRALVGSPGFQYLDVSAADTYLATALYRREVALIDLPEEGRYILDLFRVDGGDRHDYSIHGFDGEFSVENLEVTEPQPGTLAGPNVSFGELYDEPDLDRPYKNRSYYQYTGSGYSYLYDVQRGHPAEPWSATWRDAERGPGLRMTFLPNSTREALIATGEPPTSHGNPEKLKYILLRNRNATSTFVNILEPFLGDPQIESIVPLSGIDVPADGCIALKIVHRSGADYLMSALDSDATQEIKGQIRFRGRFGLVRVDRDGGVRELRLIGPGSLGTDEGEMAIPRPLRGRVEAVDYARDLLKVRFEGGPPKDPSALIGETIVLGNRRHTTSYTITEITPQEDGCLLNVGDETLRIGKMPVDHIAPDGAFFTSRTYLYLAPHGYYRGTRLVDESGSVSLSVEDVKIVPHKENTRRASRITVVDDTDLREAFKVGDMAYLYDVGPGDRFEIAAHAYAVRDASGTFEIQGNCTATWTSGGLQ